MSAPRSPAAEAVELAGRLGRAMARPGVSAREVADLVAGDVHDDGAPLGLRAQPDRGGVDTVAVTRRWGSEEPDTAEIVLEHGLPLAALEAEFGAARRIPRSPHGRENVVLSVDDGGWTVLAGLDDGDVVRALTVRRDS